MYSVLGQAILDDFIWAAAFESHPPDSMIIYVHLSDTKLAVLTQRPEVHNHQWEMLGLDSAALLAARRCLNQFHTEDCRLPLRSYFAGQSTCVSAQGHGLLSKNV